jgi:hypothetical protein
MEMRGSFKHLPTAHKVFYLTMLLMFPAAMVILFLILMFVVELKEFIWLALPLIFAVVSPAVVLKDLLNPEIIISSDDSVRMEKRFGKKLEVKFTEIKAGIGLVTEDRKVIFLISKPPPRIIAASDWFSMKEKEELMSLIKDNAEKYDYEYKEFGTKDEAMAHARSFF